MSSQTEDRPAPFRPMKLIATILLASIVVPFAFFCLLLAWWVCVGGID